MSEDRGSFLIDGTCPECELSRGRHKVWCSAFDPDSTTAPGDADPPDPANSPQATDKE
jgi:hypothetical protein